MKTQPARKSLHGNDNPGPFDAAAASSSSSSTPLKHDWFGGMRKLLLSALPLVLASCLLPPPPPSHAPSRPPRHGHARPAPPPRPHQPHPARPAPFHPENLIGLPEAEAIHRAREAGLACRVVERNGVAFPVTMDYSETRLNLAVRNGRVMRVTRG
jgi:hypothetical protein